MIKTYGPSLFLGTLKEYALIVFLRAIFALTNGEISLRLFPTAIIFFFMGSIATHFPSNLLRFFIGTLTLTMLEL